MTRCSVSFSQMFLEVSISPGMWYLGIGLCLKPYLKEDGGHAGFYPMWQRDQRGLMRTIEIPPFPVCTSIYPCGPSSQKQSLLCLGHPWPEELFDALYKPYQWLLPVSYPKIGCPEKLIQTHSIGKQQFSGPERM